MEQGGPEHDPGAIERISDGEARFDAARRAIGLVAGPLLCAALLLFPPPAPTPEATRLVAVFGLVLTWWVTEAVPIAVTSLVGPALAVVLGVGSAAELFAGFGDPVVLFFLGGFVLARGMEVSGLDRRVALAILARPAVSGSPLRIVAAFAALAAGVSAWMNNASTTATLYPIALSVLTALARASGRDPTRLHFATALLLALAYAASIGGITTPVGTAPNLIALGQLRKLAGVDVLFFQWMVIAAPIAVAMLAVMLVYFRFALPPDLPVAGDAAQHAARERAALGGLTRAQRNVLFAFAATVSMWVAPGLVSAALGAEHPFAASLARRLPESVAALLGASLLFVLPVERRSRRRTLSWTEAVHIDWATLLLFGGGLALGGAMFRTGLAEAIGTGLVSATGADSLVALTCLFAWIAIVLTEITSNTVATTMLAPLGIAAAQAAGVSPIPPALALAIGASMAFMLPISTPPNAIVYGSGAISIGAMARHGFVLDVASAVIVPGGVLLGCRLLGLA